VTTALPITYDDPELEKKSSAQRSFQSVLEAPDHKRNSQRTGVPSPARGLASDRVTAAIVVHICSDDGDNDLNRGDAVKRA
jgi:hypothetical protein